MTGEVDAGVGALDGLRVLEIGSLIAGPFAGRLLADFGADIIKVEAPNAADPLREWGQGEVDGQHFFWTSHVRNKRCITLNLREAAGQQMFLDLSRHADVVVESFRWSSAGSNGSGRARTRCVGSAPGLSSTRRSRRAPV